MRMDVVHASKKKRVCRPLPSQAPVCISGRNESFFSSKKAAGSDDAVFYVLPCFCVALRSGPKGQMGDSRRAGPFNLL